MYTFRVNYDNYDEGQGDAEKSTWVEPVEGKPMKLLN